MKTTIKFTIGALMATASLISTTSVFARDDMNGEHRKKMHEQEVAACQGKTEGSSVSMNHPVWGNVTAVCAPDRDGKLAAMPAKEAEHRKAAVTSCQGKSKGDKVSLPSYHEEGKSIEATCVQGKGSQELVARPAHMKKHMKAHKDM